MIKNKILSIIKSNVFVCFLLFSFVMILSGCEDDKDDFKYETAKRNLKNMYWEFGGITYPGKMLHPEDTRVSIKNLKINNRSGLTYNWVSSDSTMKWWNEKSPEDYSVGIACCGFYDEKNSCWRVGKFDWISSSRLSRDFHNINSRYKGWNPDLFYNSKYKCFFILKSDKSVRSNILIYTDHSVK